MDRNEKRGVGACFPSSSLSSLLARVLVFGEEVGGSEVGNGNKEGNEDEEEVAMMKEQALAII